MKHKLCILILLALVLLSLFCGTCGESAESQQVESQATDSAAIRAQMSAWETAQWKEAVATSEAIRP
ncbi:MAG: hypothetical protein ABIH23_18245 [bacterium]